MILFSPACEVKGLLLPSPADRRLFKTTPYTTIRIAGALTAILGLYRELLLNIPLRFESSKFFVCSRKVRLGRVALVPKDLPLPKNPKPSLNPPEMRSALSFQGSVVLFFV